MRTTISAFVAGLLLASAVRATPVSDHGQLSVRGTTIIDQFKRPVVLTGVSFFWSQWQGDFWNAPCVDWLAQDWRVSVVRAAVGVESGGYLDRPGIEQSKVEAVVDAAIAAGVYVIIDWHDHHATAHPEAAETFFRAMAHKYRGNPAVIYEIFNEPLKVSWDMEVKPYAERIIAAIRETEPNALIIVGTPQWCQRIEDAAADPIAGKNLLYALHFYAGSHKAWLRQAADRAMARGLPIFVSEWGGCNADGNGDVDRASTDQWLDWMRNRGLSHCCWAVSKKPETSSLMRRSAATTGGWKERDLSPWGRLMRETLRAANAPAEPADVAKP